MSADGNEIDIILLLIITWYQSFIPLKHGRKNVDFNSFLSFFVLDSFFLMCPCFHHILVIYSSKLSSTNCSIFAHFWLILYNHNNGQQCSFRIFIFKKNEWVFKKYCKLIETYKHDYKINDIHEISKNIYFLALILLILLLW